jgi:ABC-type phosphate transport system substrate-binding protein
MTWARLLLIITAFSCIHISHGVASEPVAVIVNINNPIDSLNNGDIKKIYNNNTLKWHSGVPIILYDLAIKDPAREIFSKMIFRSPSRKIAEKWAHLKITNQAKNPPINIKNPLLLIKRVALTEGAIGYVSLSALENVNDPDVKIVAVLQ